MTTPSRSAPGAWRRFGLAAWLSLALHAVLIGVVQVSPRSAPPMPLWIEARLQPVAKPILQPAPLQPGTAPALRVAAGAMAQDAGPAPSATVPLSSVQAAPSEGVSARAESLQRARVEVPGERAPSIQQAAAAEGATTPTTPLQAPPAQPAAVQPAPAQPTWLQPAAARSGPTERMTESRPNNPESSTKEPVPAVDVPLVAETRYFAAKELDVPPRPLHKIEPAYPREYERRDVTGQVLLEVRVETDGQVSGLRVIETSPNGYEAFEREALTALRMARFAPARRDGRAVRALVNVRVIFELSD